jgi:phospholipid/cholesterol/gamma-HCH transport system substrate-binding protein
MHVLKGQVLGAAAVAAAVAVAMAGCDSGGFSGIYSLPLPGGASLGTHPYRVTAQISDALDLVPQSAVQVNDVAVGRVAKISVPVNKWYADVTMVINSDVHLPANAVAQVEQSSLLGEEYVALGPPPGIKGTGRLVNDATIPLQRTTSNATVEEVLGALSLLLNDGGIAQLHTITVQLNDAMNGNEPQIRSMLSQINVLVSNLNSHRGDITAALDGLNELSRTLAVRDRQIGYVLDNLSPGLNVLDQQRDQLVTMLNSLHTLSGVAVNTISQSKADMVADLKALAPTLRELAAAGKALPQSLQVLLTYPFTDQVLSDVKGDYLNAYLNVTASPGTCVYAPLPVPTSAATATPSPSPSPSPTASPAQCPAQQPGGGG